MVRREDFSNVDVVSAVIHTMVNYHCSSQNIKEVIQDMVGILTQDTATEEELEGARATIIFALFRRMPRIKKE